MAKLISCEVGLILAVILNVVISADVETRNGIFKTNCFVEDDEGRCEFSRVKICDDFYACDLLVKFPSPVRRIGYKDGGILAAEGSKIYHIDENTMTPSWVRDTIPPHGELVDSSGNRYYSAEGTTYMSDIKTGKEIEIITTGQYSFNQLALDVKAGKLFVLSFITNTNSEQKVGRLYAMALNNYEIKEDKIYAEHVEGDDNITAMAVQESLDKLLLGLRSKDGGKLIRLTRQRDDPCEFTTPREAIVSVIKEAQNKLIKIFDESPGLNVRFGGNDTQEDFSLDNEKLKLELENTTFVLNVLKTKLYTISNNLKMSLIYSLPSEEKNSSTPSSNFVTSVPAREECLPAEDLEFLRTRVADLSQKERDLQDQLKRVSRNLDGLLRESGIYD